MSLSLARYEKLIIIVICNHNAFKSSELSIFEQIVDKFLTEANKLNIKCLIFSIESKRYLVCLHKFNAMGQTHFNKTPRQT